MENPNQIKIGDKVKVVDNSGSYRYMQDGKYIKIKELISKGDVLAIDDIDNKLYKPGDVYCLVATPYGRKWLSEKRFVLIKDDES
jgi:hypothetical protein